MSECVRYVSTIEGTAASALPVALLCDGFAWSGGVLGGCFVVAGVNARGG